MFRRLAQFPVRGESSAGDDAVHMDVIIHLLVPCMKDLDDAGNSTKILFIRRKLKECFGTASVKKGIQKLLVAIDQRIELMRQRKNDVEIRRIDHLRPAFINPYLFCDSLTVWTVPVPAGVIVNKQHAVGMGGGICQVSSTLYSAMVNAGIPATERHAHSLPVPYISRDREASISAGAMDLRFTNILQNQLYIQAFYGDGFVTVMLIAM